jgi:hypothetical protein
MNTEKNMAKNTTDEDKASEAAPMQNPSNFAGRTYKDFLAANGLPMPQGAQGN